MKKLMANDKKSRMDKQSFEKERKRLTNVIKHWNDSRLDMFAITLPDEKLEFHGVMRFYHKDSSSTGKYATKCIRVSSTTTTVDAIEMLSSKFRPDMRMLTTPSYDIYEVHVNGEMRLLNKNEKPLLVQLNWCTDDREGRFLLHDKNDKGPVHLTEQLYAENGEDSSFKLTRTLTKREKKLKKKQEKEKLSKKGVHNSSNENTEDARHQENYAVKHLYTQVPESTFTRTVSNPEAVMKKRREQKLQKRGANILKVYGDTLNPEIPYKSLLLLPSDNVTTVIRDTLDKYGLGKESVKDYNLIQVVLPPNSKPDEMLNGGWGMETVMPEDKCPLQIEQEWKLHEGTLVFQLRSINPEKSRKKEPSVSSNNTSASEKPGKEDTDKKKTKKKNVSSPSPKSKEDKSSAQQSQNKNGVVTKSVGKGGPKFLEFSTSSDHYRDYAISPNVTEIGSDKRKANYGPFIEISDSSDILPSHCVVTNMDGVVSVTPQNKSEVFVDGLLISETTMMSHGCVVSVGKNKDLVFVEHGGKISIPQFRKKLQACIAARSQVKAKSQARVPPPSSNMRERHGSNEVLASGQKVALVPPNLRHPASDSGPLSRQSEERGNQYINQGNVQRGPVSSTSSSQSKLSSHGHDAYKNQMLKNQSSPILPASVQLRNGAEESFLMEVVSVSGGNVHFKLSPAYVLYLSLRDIVEVTPKSSLEPVLVEYLCTTTDLLDQTIQLNSKMASELAFWMANASELLNFARHDRDLASCTAEAQDSLAKTVQLAFRHLVQCMQKELFQLMPAFLSPSNEDLPGGNPSNSRRREPGEQSTMYDILRMLSSAMGLLRRCRVNAALTIQLFSQLFHFINMWIFNEVVCKPELGLCCRSWGLKIRARLARVEAWAEKQGLELAADCHLARVTQAMHLLQSPKQSAEDIAAISGTCFKLNSLQLRALLSRYRPSEMDGETQIPNELIDKVVQVAQNTADELTRSDGRDVQLEEDPDLQLPFLLPEDGYSCDVVNSVPSGLTEFARPLVAESLCAYTVNSDAPGSWTVYFHGAEAHQATANGTYQQSNKQPPMMSQQPEIVTVTFNKHGGGMGLSIVAARGPGQDQLGIYIRSVVKGGAAYKDGRLQAGDQLVSVDGHSLIGLSQERAADVMTKTGQMVTLTVAKQAVHYHGLGPLLSPSPQDQSKVTHRRPGSSNQARPKSEGYALQQQGYQPKQIPPASYADRRQPPINDKTKPLALYQNKRKSPINKSTPQLNENEKLPVVSRPLNPTPRSAVSMGNLQHTPVDHSRSRPTDDWQRNWEAKRALNTYQKNRTKSSSNVATPLSPVTKAPESDYHYRKQVQSMITGHGPKISPRSIQNEPRPSRQQEFNYPSAMNSTSPPNDIPSPPAVTHSLDNPNYDQLPPPPSPPESPPFIVSSQERQKTDIPLSREEHREIQSPYSNSPSNQSQTMGRPTSGKKQPKVEVTPTPKSAPSSKSSTLPRHFKSGSSRVVDSAQQEVQDQLNALRDEEIDELSERIESLTVMEKSRLTNLLKEREFQRRVEEESRRFFSDEDASDEDYSVPDRPDRDRLLRLQDDNAEHDSVVYKEEKEKREEEQERRRKLERERLNREEKERHLRERLERERVLEEDQKRANEGRKLEWDRRQHQEEARRRADEEERGIRQEEERKIREWQEHQERQRRIQEEEKLEKERQENLRTRRDAEERTRQEFQAQREAQERAWRIESEQKRRRERRMKKHETADDEAEREFLERKLSQGKPSNNPYGSMSRQRRVANATMDRSNPTMRGNSYRAPRPVSDGYMLGKMDWQSEDLSQPYAVAASVFNVSDTSPAKDDSPHRPVSYIATSNAPRVIGSQERYRDPRDRREAELRREISFKRRVPEPSCLTFKDRQKMFSSGKNTPLQKTKASKTLIEIENSLKREMS